MILGEGGSHQCQGGSRRSSAPSVNHFCIFLRGVTTNKKVWSADKIQYRKNPGSGVHLFCLLWDNQLLTCWGLRQKSLKFQNPETPSSSTNIFSDIGPSAKPKSQEAQQGNRIKNRYSTNIGSIFLFVLFSFSWDRFDGNRNLFNGRLKKSLWEQKYYNRWRIETLAQSNAGTLIAIEPYSFPIISRLDSEIGQSCCRSNSLPFFSFACHWSYWLHCKHTDCNHSVSKSYIWQRPLKLCQARCA